MTVTLTRAGRGGGSKPEFASDNPRMALAQLGSETHLPCLIHHIHNEKVSWMRKLDQHILTVDNFTFIGDERFSAKVEEGEFSVKWTLTISSVSERDAQTYECQISTSPKQSLSLDLYVAVPRVEIVGDAEVVVQSGSRVDLKCRMRGILEMPHKVIWYRNGKKVVGIIHTAPEGHSSSTQGIIVGPEERSGSPETPVYMSTLMITHARKEDAGNYSCVPHDEGPKDLPFAKVTLHVISGEQPAAMQHSNRACGISGFPGLLAACLPLTAVLARSGHVT
ncbi:unnamed protein product [Darwinula stevensoni]|uniref:Ig-like domain-containing protein n=1 Tax=Darwinula stevensoni TaxID=69355 RepID=A0A7R8XH72_9CRUS|nr:unnamed protein product [Darwinula stevensoni]CAG0892246.1 unnamed protein product [Darwinula stevensoni]